MLIAELLIARDRLYLEWCEPWPGCSAAGYPTHATVKSRATVQDCIDMARLNAVKSGKTLSDAELLDDFIVVNWAQLYKPEAVDGKDQERAEERHEADVREAGSSPGACRQSHGQGQGSSQGQPEAEEVNPLVKPECLHCEYWIPSRGLTRYKCYVRGTCPAFEEKQKER